MGLGEASRGELIKGGLRMKISLVGYKIFGDCVDYFWRYASWAIVMVVVNCLSIFGLGANIVMTMR